MAVQDRRERLPLAPPLLVAPRPDREPERLRDHRGDRSGPEPPERRADRNRGRARVDARAAAPCDPAPRVAGPLLSRDRRGARGHPVGRRDADLPRPPLARRRARAAGLGQEAEAQELPPRSARVRHRHDRRCVQDAARWERGRQGDRRCRRGHSGRHVPPTASKGSSRSHRSGQPPGEDAGQQARTFRCARPRWSPRLPARLGSLQVPRRSVRPSRPWPSPQAPGPDPATAWS